MGKVGSRTVFRSLADLPLAVPVYHAHFLTNLDRLTEQVTQWYADPSGPLRAIREGRRARRALDKAPRQPCHLVTLCREPVARNVSLFFHSLEGFHPDARDRVYSGKWGVKELTDLFLHQWRHDSEVEWFDLYSDVQWLTLQFQEMSGMDVFGKPFPAQQGFQVMRRDRFSLLILRLEDLNRCAAQAFHEFLGIPNFRLIRANVGNQKWYGDVYREFMSQLSLPDAYLDRIYESRVARHFYTAEEIETFRAKWSRRPRERRAA
jgi:hypothetical protein